MDKITSRKNKLVTLFKTLVNDSKERKEQNSFVLDGPKLILEAIQNEFALRSPVLVTEKALIKYSEIIEQISRIYEICVISSDISDYISDTKSPQGMFAISLGVDIEENHDKINNGKRLVILDGIQDAGNAGTIIRTAEAFGFDGVVLSDNSVDIYSPKLIRASMGSCLRLPIIETDLLEYIDILKNHSYNIYGALLDSEAESLTNTVFADKSAIVIGSEGTGISSEVIEICDSKIYIEINGTQSLNAAAAAAVLCWEMRKK